MSIPHVLARSIQRLANAFGYSVARLGASHITMEAALRGVVSRNHGIRSVVDVGASDGNWSELAMRQLPDCAYLLVEAQPVHEVRLRAFCSRHRNASYALVAAGESEGTINFDATDPFGGQASERPFPSNNIVIPVEPLDRVIAARNLPGPYLLKLDTHGYEVQILKGARAILEETEVIVMECYNFQIAPESLLFDEMCRHLRALGFRCIDLVCPLHRPLDDAFWQMDLVFARETRPEFRIARYS